MVFALLFAVALSGATGIETDSPRSEVRHAACVASWPHLKVTAWDLRDRTDSVGDLVETSEWLLLPGTAPVEITANVVDVMDVVTGEGTV